MGALSFWRAPPRLPAPAAGGTPRPTAGLRRRLNLIILGHLWVLTPLAVAWFLVPAWRDPGQPGVAGLGTLTLSAVGYLAVRTWWNLTGRAPGLSDLYPYVDVLLVSTALVLLRNPADALIILYFIPLTSAAATLNLRHMAALGAVTVGSYLVVVVASDAAWTVALVYRLVIIGLMASLYGWVLRAVTGHVRAIERVEFQRQLAREIHDSVQHELITLGVRLELAHRLVEEDPIRARQIVGEEREAVRRAADSLRYLVRRLRVEPPQPADSATALRLQIATLAERLPYTLKADLPPRLPPLSPALEPTLLRIIQECLTNIAKHARATQADLHLAAAEGVLRLTVADNGVGFDPAAAAGGGLDGLRERLQAVSGELRVRSAPGGGTTVEVSIPLKDRR